MKWKKKTAVISVVLLLLWCAGCGSDLLTGIGIGAGTSGAVSEGQQLAEQHKSALIATILDLRTQLEQTTEPAEVADLQAKLAKLERRRDIADITSTVADQVKEGVTTGRSPPDIAITAVLTALLGWQTRKRKIAEKTVNYAEGTASPERATEIHDYQSDRDKRPLG